MCCTSLPLTIPSAFHALRLCQYPDPQTAVSDGGYNILRLVARRARLRAITPRSTSPKGLGGLQKAPGRVFGPGGQFATERIVPVKMAFMNVHVTTGCDVCTCCM